MGGYYDSSEEFDSAGECFDSLECPGNFYSRPLPDLEKSSPDFFYSDQDDLDEFMILIEDVIGDNDIDGDDRMPPGMLDTGDDDRMPPGMLDTGDNDSDYIIDGRMSPAMRDTKDSDSDGDSDDRMSPPLFFDDTDESNIGFDLRSEEGTGSEEEPQRSLMLPELPPKLVNAKEVEILENSAGYSGTFVPSPPEASKVFGCSGVCEKIDHLPIFQGTNFIETVNRSFLSVALGCDEGLFQPHEVSACSTARSFIGLLMKTMYQDEDSEVFVYQREEGLLFGMEDMKTRSNIRGPKPGVVMEKVRIDENGKEIKTYLKPLLARKNSKVGWFVCKLFKSFLLLKDRTQQQQQQKGPQISGKKKKKKKKMKFTNFKSLMVLYLEAFEGLMKEFQEIDHPNPKLHENLKKNINEELVISLKKFRSKSFKNSQMDGCLLYYVFCKGFQKSGRFFHTYRRSVKDKIEEDNGFNVDVFREYVENYEDLVPIRHLCEKFVWRRDDQKNVFKLVKIAAAFFIIKAKDYEEIGRKISEILEEKLKKTGKKRKKRSSSEDLGDNNNNNADVLIFSEEDNNDFDVQGKKRRLL